MDGTYYQWDQPDVAIGQKCTELLNSAGISCAHPANVTPRSRRTPLPLYQSLLREWRLIYPRRDTGRKDSLGEPIKELDLVFPNGRRKVESLANMINRGLLPAQIWAGVTVDTGVLDADGRAVLAARYTGMHALRHFYASWCINRPQDGESGCRRRWSRNGLGTLPSI